MEKKDLKNGMFVLFKDGSKAVYVNRHFVYQDRGWDGLSYWDNDLKIVEKHRYHYSFRDVKAVYNSNCFDCMDNDTLIWERPEEKQEILNKEEKEYLSAVIKPFRNRIYSFSKIANRDIERLTIKMSSVIDSLTDECFLPVFIKGTMYKGMNTNENYTLKELGL